MKVRKLAVALALAGGLGSGVAQALGLGEIELQSYLNQPLNAEIDVNRAGGVSPDDIIVNLASQRDYERVGLRRDFFLTQLDFNVTTAPDGQLVISVTSREPVREPYLNFLVEVTWPSGRVMREYAVLVDPPVYAEDSGVSQPVQQARSTGTTSGSQAAPQPRTQASPSTARQSSGAASSGPRTLGPVQASDTLWEIARSVRPNNSVSVQQVMLAIQDLNPDAFIDGNINRLKRGAVLRVPDINDVQARTQAQANREVAAQNQAIARPAPTVDATDDAVATTTGSGAGAQESTDELRLVVPGDGETTRSDGSAGSDGTQGGTADVGSAMALEELDRVQRENEELNSRLQDLQDQLETLERLIELKDNQLAEMQGTAAQAGDDLAVAPGGEADDAAAPSDTAFESTLDEGVPGDEAGADPAEDDSSELAGDLAGTAVEPGDEATEQGATPATDMESPAGPEGGEEPEGPQDFMPADDPVVASGESSEPQQVPATTDSEPEKGFLATAIELIAGNFLYQIALGGFLVLLLLLVLLVSRRRAGREDDFYEGLDDESDDGDFELTLGEQGAADSANAIEEADRYLSFGQYDAAAEVLEGAISREPSRSDLRLKLLSVYADMGNRAAFDKQYAELDAMDDGAARPEAEALRARLEEMESTPSIDELESQLRDGDAGAGVAAATGAAVTRDERESNDLISAFEELDLPEEPQGQEADDTEDEGDIEYDFTGFDTSGEAAAEPADEPADSEPADDFDTIEFELPEESAATDADTIDAEELLDPENDLTSLELDEAGFDPLPPAENTEGAAEISEEDELDFGDLDLDGVNSAPAQPEPVDESHNPEEEAELDESFLDELDAELDRVASDSEANDGLDDLELDVSDEDLALIDEASESEPDDESRLDLSDLELDDSDLAGDDAVSEDDLSDLEIPELDAELDEEIERVPGSESGSGIDGIDESALGDDDDDFDFLSGTDEVATKLDLARAYVDMGDSEGAREILEEVILEGNDEQKDDAQALLKKLP